MQGPPATNSSPASAGTADPSETNTRTLVAFIASLIVPLAVAVDALAVLIIVKHGPYILQSVAILAGSLLSVVGLLATAGAIIVGHTALMSAKRSPLADTRRWMAKCFLVNHAAQGVSSSPGGSRASGSSANGLPRWSKISLGVSAAAQASASASTWANVARWWL
jgi:hypothetical protein